MKKTDIKRHLKEYSIFSNRHTTINHAFASALSVADLYDDKKIDDALKILGQNPHKDLRCVYCDKLTETWDHVIALVNKGNFSGFGHQINNLVPCCKKCNSAKGNKPWKDFVKSNIPKDIQQILIDKIEAYINYNSNSFEDLKDDNINAEISKLAAIKEEILNLMIKADEQAKIIRDKLINKSKDGISLPKDN